MRKTDLHPALQANCVPVPGKSGCYAVVPPAVPLSVDVPRCYGLFAVARRELEVLGELMTRRPEQAGLLFGMLNRREAVDSSQIEGTRTGFDDLLLHEIETDTPDAVEDADASETFAYVRAFVAGSRAVLQGGEQAVDLDLIRQLHAVLMSGQPRSLPGSFRDRQNYIGMPAESARYIPPPPDEVPRLMADLLRVLQYRPEGAMEVSVLMRAAIAHAQFEAIHPFLDGNGRTGRLLLPLMFLAAGQPPIHLATFLKVRQQEYYEALLAVQLRLDWTPWLTLFLECCIASCRHTAQLFAVLEALRADWQTRLREARKRKDAAAWRLVDLLLGQPVVTVGEVVRRLDISFPAANSAVEDMVRIGALRPVNDRTRHRVFHAHELMNALYTGLDVVLTDAAKAGQIGG